MRHSSLSTALFLLALALLPACKDDYLNFNKAPVNIKTGTAVEVTAKTIGSEGGTLSVSMPGTPVDGIELTVPANSYPSSETFTITYSEIKSHSFGANFNPISPMITVQCDGGYAKEPMNITIPVTLPAGSVAVGFFYDTSTGKLEGIPVISATSGSITLSTRHFLSGNMLRVDASPLKSASAEKNGGANIIITSFTESMLLGQPIIASGYKPGTDDWEFVNYGSYLATGGHCAGQNMTAMWYYFEKKASDGNLNGKFRDNPKLWQSDAGGYRFCSVIHSDLEWSGIAIDMFDKFVDKNQAVDKLKLLTIAATMLVTGEPQGIGIYRLKGARADGTPIYGGHDLICYQVSVSDGKLYISDPNKPGVGQVIEYANERFKPYIAMLNGHAASNPYPFVTYYAKTAYIEWNKIGKRYAELLNNTIGTVAPNNFPDYTIWVKGKEDRKMVDGFSIDSDTLRCTVECPTTERGFHVGNKWLIWNQMFNDQGAVISHWEGSGKTYTILKPGLNKIGFYVTSKKTDGVDGDGNMVDLFIDFKWFNIYFSKLRISPDPIAGEPGKDVKITANTDGTAPASAKYLWNFGDGSKEVTIQNDSTVVHKFSKKGEYIVTVTLIDNSSAKEMGKAAAPASIQDGILGFLQLCRWIDLTFSADIKCNQTGVCFSGVDIDNEPPYQSTVKCPLKWTGTHFSTDYSYSYDTFDGDHIDCSGTIQGDVSANGLMVTNFSGTYKSKSNGGKDSVNKTLSGTNVPYDPTYQYSDITPRFVVDGPQVKSHISDASSNYAGVTSSGDSFNVVMTGINYDNPDDVPYLWVTFFGKQ